MPPLVAVIVAVPTATEVTYPDESTRATAVLLLPQVTTAERVFSALSRTRAERRADPPGESTSAPGVTMTDAGRPEGRSGAGRTDVDSPHASRASTAASAMRILM